MAKLKAHGHEVLRYSKERAITDTNEYVDWERTTWAVMSDGVVLTKRDVNFKASTVGSYERPAYRHTWGWKRHGKLKACADIAATRERAIAAGFTVEAYDGPVASC